ncbi:hypothetical protein JCM11251_004781 [Rhodosporidiobolus azoricus]
MEVEQQQRPAQQQQQASPQPPPQQLHQQPTAAPLSPAGPLAAIPEHGEAPKHPQPQSPAVPAPPISLAAPGPTAADFTPSQSSQKSNMDDNAEATAAATALANVAANAASAAAAASAAPASAPTDRPAGSFDPAAPNAVNGLPNPLPANYDKSQPICANCATQTTPLWRRSHDSTHILCNACALFYKMKGRPRPISLKTDVIKSRNRSKGKSTSKDRAGKSAAANSAAAALASPVARGVSKERSESMTRAEGGRKSVPGGSGADEDQDMKDGRQKPFGDGASLDGGDARKARKVVPTGAVPPYGIPYPGYPYPFPFPHGAHPHGHQPYPPRSRSRSSDPTRRGQSIDARARGVGGSTTPTEGSPAPNGATPPIPPGLPYGYPGFVPGAPLPEGYPAYPPFYPYGGPPPGFNPGQPPYPFAPPFAHPAAALAHAAQAALHNSSAVITHAQSDSRSHSPAPATDASAAASRAASARGSASPPHTSAAAPTAPAAIPTPPQSWYPHPNPNYHLHQPHTHSPLAGNRPTISRNTSSSSHQTAKPASASADEAKPDPSPRPSLAPLAGADAAEKAAASAHPLASSTTVPRPISLFPPGVENAHAGPSAIRERGASVSSAASRSEAGSSDGVRSPEATSRALAPSWSSLNGAAVGGGTPSDERRGRPEKRFEDYGASPVVVSANGKGKARDSSMEDLDEVDELDDDGASPAGGAGSSNSGSHGRTGARMNGVEAGLGELRVSSSSSSQAHLHASRPMGSPGVPGAGNASHHLGGSSRSRSRARGENERGRSRGVLGGPSIRAGSVNSGGGGGSRVRGSSSASSAGAGNRGREGTASLAGGKEHWPADALAEMTRLKTKISELTFLNGLMQSRLAQLEGPGRVPRNVMTSLTAETPRPDPDEMLYAEEDDDEEMGRPEPIEEEVPAAFA